MNLYKIWIRIIAPFKRGHLVVELRHCIEAIEDPRGSEHAIGYHSKCTHIVNHYSLSLKTAGYNGTLDDLWKLALISVKRAREREKEVLQQFKLHSA